MNNLKFNKVSVLCFLMLIILPFEAEASNEWDRLLNLKGLWKFSIGDDKKWAESNFDDSDWESIHVPSSWEDEGFYGYNGYAWYRTEFDLPNDFDEEIVYLFLGYIDDVDEVYLNGQPVGSSGKFPPDFKTAYNAERKYPISLKHFRPGKKNTLAVRVYDYYREGGIVSGNVGLYVKSYRFLVQKNLEGTWKFKTGDKPEYKDPELDDSKWDEIIVPGYWETQGYNEYNGMAWYRKTFTISKPLDDDKLVMLLGKIDDLDETYLNGKLIGRTGEFKENTNKMKHNNEWQEMRGYLFPANLLNQNGENVIAVRVYDGYINGGIYEGPIGITTQKNYQKAWKRISKKKNFWDLFFRD